MSSATNNRNQNRGRAAATASRKPRLLSLMAVMTVAVGMLVAVTGPASAATPVSVPLRASVSGTVEQTGEDTFELEGTGIGIHLGLLDDYRGEVTITSIGDDGVINDTLVETFTAANGDTLVIRCDQVVIVGADGLLHGTDTWTVLGGTGRFQNATGSGTGTTVTNLQTFTKELTGTISY